MGNRASLAVATTFLVLATAEGVALAECPASAVRWASSSSRLYITGPVTCTLTDLDPLVSHAVLERTSKSAKIWALRANVVLREGATLSLAGDAVGGDVNELRLKSDATRAVYILADWGNLVTDTVRVTSWDEAAGAPDTAPGANGRAYILAKSRLDPAGVARESRLDLRTSFFGYLGHGEKSDTYGVALKVVGTPGAVRARGALVENQLLHNHIGVTVFGGGDVSLTGNLIWGSHAAGVSVKDTVGLTVIDNDITENAKHGFYCSQGCDGVFLQSNRIFENIGSGVVLRRCAGPPSLDTNQLYRNTEAGLALVECHGATVRFNDFYENKRGVRLSSGASDNLFELNDIEDNAQGIYLYRGEAPTTGDRRPRGNTFLRNDLFRNGFAVYSNQSDENQFVRNIVGEHTPNLDGAILFQDSLDNVLAGNVIPENALIHTRGSSGTALNARTVITQAGFLPQAISPLYIETSGNADTFFVETRDLTHTQDGSVLLNIAYPDRMETRLPRISRRLYSSFPYFVKPASGQLYVYPGTTNRFNVTNWWATVSADFTVGKLAPSTAYRVKRDGVVILTTTSDASGVVRFTDTVPGANADGWGTNVRYEVLQ
jgi:hypothetical protein